MSFDIGWPLAKAMDTARFRLQFLWPGSSVDPDLDAAHALDEHANVSKAAIARLLAGLPAEAFKGRQLNPARRAACLALIEKFQSLGCNCEFGFVQRLFGAEPLDLFRFSAVSPAGLVAALESRLTELEKPEHLRIEFDGEFENGQPQTALISTRYRIHFHAGSLMPHVGFDEVKAVQVKKLTLLARKFREDLEEAKRIFVCKCDASEQPHVLRLAQVLRTFGPTDLLWVTQAEPGKPAGSVERISEGLMRGYIDRFASPKRIWVFSGPLWLTLCCNAFLVHINQTAPACRDRV